MNEKALAIFDIAMKISQNTPTDVFCWYTPHVNAMDVDIHWDGWSSEYTNYTKYIVPCGREPHYGDADVDEVLRILEEIWAAAQAKEVTV